jgi:hypothetical protein
MTDATKLIAGLLLIAITTIEFGGTFLLSMLSGKHSEFQRSMFRAGHAHAGVLVILALIALVFTDQAGLSASTHALSHPKNSPTNRRRTIAPDWCRCQERQEG